MAIRTVSTAAAARERKPKLAEVLLGVARCPHCSIAVPALRRLWISLVQGANGPPRPWALRMQQLRWGSAGERLFKPIGGAGDMR